MTKQAGWNIVSTEINEGAYLLTIEMTSVDPCSYNEELHEQLHNELIAHTHRTETSSGLFTFDHNPTTAEVEQAVTERGFNPVLNDIDRGVIVMYGHGNLDVDENNSVTRKTNAIKTITEGEDDVLEYNFNLHNTEFMNLYSMLPISVDRMPTSMSLKGDWLHLYYVNAEHAPPEQFFADSFFLYSVRIHKDTGEIKRKGYDKGMTLDEETVDSLQGFDTLENIVATGTYLDEPRVTIYHMKSSDKEDYVNNVSTVEIPYYGTTFENGVIVRVREYLRNI